MCWLYRLCSLIAIYLCLLLLFPFDRRACGNILTAFLTSCPAVWTLEVQLYRVGKDTMVLFSETAYMPNNLRKAGTGSGSHELFDFVNSSRLLLEGTIGNVCRNVEGHGFLRYECTTQLRLRETSIMNKPMLSRYIGNGDFRDPPSTLSSFCITDLSSQTLLPLYDISPYCSNSPTSLPKITRTSSRRLR
jgi:hypothetical protein